MSHVHITSDGVVIGTLFLDHHGHVADDGTPAAINAMDHTNHGHRREDGQQALDAIVAHLDKALLVGAHHCHEDHRHGTATSFPVPEDEEGYSDDRSSTEPTPQDPWPEFGELTNEDKHQDIAWSDDGHGLQ